MKVRLLALLLVIVAASPLRGGPLDTLRTGYTETLARFKAIYEAELEKIDSQFRDESLALPQAHIQDLRELEQTYQREGELQSLLAVEEERRRFARNPAPGEITVSTTSRRLAALQRGYMDDVETVRSQRDSRRALLTERYEQRVEQHRAEYLRALGRLQRELTQQGDIASALEVLQEAERIRSGAPPGERDSEPASRPDGRSPDGTAARPAPVSLSLEALRRALGADIGEWNSQSRRIVLEFDFARAAALRGWSGGTHDRERKLLVCDGTVVWLQPAFESIEELEVESLFLDARRRARVMLGQAGAVQLTVEVAGDRGDPRVTAFQALEDRPLMSQSADVKLFIENHLALQLEDEDLYRTINYGPRGRSRLQRTLRFPARVGLGYDDASTGFRRVRVSGVLSEAAVRELAAAAER